MVEIQQTSGVRYATAQVNNVNGVILLPDNWSSSYYSLNDANSFHGSFNSNIISQNDWNTHFEANGAVFLPAAGYRSYLTVYDVNTAGNYWSATDTGSADNAYSVFFREGDFAAETSAIRYVGKSVRLVHNAN